MRTMLIAVAALALSATAAGAAQCPALQAQLDTELGRRFDGTAARARAVAAEAMALHRAGKHAESVAKYDEAAKAAGVMLKKK
jgi:hypothetical protein